MNDQTKRSVEWHLEYTENLMQNVKCSGCLATNQSIEELTKALENVVLAIREIVKE